MTAFLQYQYIQSLTTILIQSQAIKHNQISAIALQELIHNGCTYQIKNGQIIVELEGRTLSLPEQLLTMDTGVNCYTESSFDTPTEVPKASEIPKTTPSIPDMDWLPEEGKEENNTIRLEEKQTEDWLENLMSGLTEDSSYSPHTTEPYVSDFDEKPDAFPVTEPNRVPEPTKEEEQNTEPEKIQTTQELPNFTGFGRKDAFGGPIRRGREPKETEVNREEIEPGYMPPLNSPFTPNYEIAIQDCVFSMFVGEIYEETSTKKHKIYFMVAPFEIKREEPSCNILLYAFFNGQSYAVTSLSNPNKNSLLCQIAEFQFLVRGKFAEGKWSSDIQLTKDSLRRRDVFKLEQVYHNNPASIGTTNGHIRFTYEGYINHKDLKSKGCVNIFPVDVESNEFIIVRCMEDFIDILFTEEHPFVELYTHEGEKRLSVTVSQGSFQAKLEDYEEPEEGIFSE